IILLATSVRETRVAISGDFTTSAAAPRQELQPVRALDEYKETIRSRGGSLSDQGVLIQTLDGRTALAEHNADIAFNPASVMKLATTLTALARLGPDYRFRTNFLADGTLDASAHKLNGDLVVEGAQDPMFSAQDAQEVAAELVRLGVTRVTGALRIAGPRRA